MEQTKCSSNWAPKKKHTKWQFYSMMSPGNSSKQKSYWCIGNTKIARMMWDQDLSNGVRCSWKSVHGKLISSVFSLTFTLSLPRAKLNTCSSIVMSQKIPAIIHFGWKKSMLIQMLVIHFKSTSKLGNSSQAAFLAFFVTMILKQQYHGNSLKPLPQPLNNLPLAIWLSAWVIQITKNPIISEFLKIKKRNTRTMLGSIDLFYLEYCLSLD